MSPSPTLKASTEVSFERPLAILTSARRAALCAARPHAQRPPPVQRRRSPPPASPACALTWAVRLRRMRFTTASSTSRPHTMRYLVFRCYNEQAHLFRMHYSQAASQCRCEKMLAPLQHLKCRCMLKHGIPHQNAPQMHRLADHTVASERKDVVCFLRVSVLGSEFSMFASCLGELSNVI